MANVQARQLKDHLCFAIYACSREAAKLYRPFLDPYGLTYPQYLVLVALSESDELTVKELGDKLYLDSGTLTPLLKRMQESGFVRRVRSKEDERKVKVSLTPRGVEVRDALATVPDCLVERVGDRYPFDLRNLLERVTKLLESIHEVNHEK
ncbi:MarR family winged helix-turn-helix transcriptional regulator [Alicyclobacillus acidiphilus]|uniref:MarR family winged helix-turn-helix transcriptional regulator n=1 Tax=Alicyclobacillus acidiphilus TaxID=182455 RepID=UPI000831C1BB|nr:MarR family transcriptional regulator [Alicyclobacillus acidiphilus]